MLRMKTYYVLALVLVIALSAPGSALTASATTLVQEADDDRVTYTVTIENLTEGQPFSPPVVTTHSEDVHVFHIGQVASDELAAIAQDGNPEPMVELFSAADGVTDVVNVGRPLMPAGRSATGEGNEFTDSASVTITAAPGDFLSLATMLICTNDGFTGLDSAVLPEDGEEAVFELNAYDAGREDNTEASADLVDPCSALGPVALEGDPNENEDTAVATAPIEEISSHPGISDTGDLSVADHGWREPIARVTIMPGDAMISDDVMVQKATYEVTLNNLTAGQPFSPPVAVTHNADVILFQSGNLASDELAAIAQDGNPEPMVELLTGADGVSDVINIGQPLTPAGSSATVGDNEFTASVTFNITAAPGDFLSLATMLICTNDGFTGLNSAVLPDDGSNVYVLRSYDAGREDNTEASADLVDPCSALGPIALEGDPNENEDTAVTTDPATPIVNHPNIAAVGDLTIADHGWEEPVATILITRLEETAMMEEIDNGLITVESSNSFSETVSLLESTLQERGLLIANVIDHQANAANAELDLLPTTLIITGRPQLGTPLMQSNRTIAIDLPQKFLVWEDEDGLVFITYNTPFYLAQRHDINNADETLEQISNALANFAAAASGAMMDEEAMDGEATEDGAMMMPPTVIVEDQTIVDEEVVITEIFSDGPGWIVIHAVADGANNDVLVTINMDMATETLYAMLHTDAGEIGTYEFPGPDGPVSVDGEVITPAFTATSE